MKLELKGNPNYCTTVIDIKNIVELEGCDNIKGTNIFGCHVIVSKDTKIGDIGLFFPVETKISEEFLSHNSLYRDKTLNRVKDKAGFFELNGRIRCVKLRGFKSEGFWIPIESLLGLISVEDVNRLKIGNEFDYINSNNVCEKYINKKTQVQGSGNKKSKSDKKLKRFDRLISKYWNFHEDTLQLYRNLHKIKEDSYCSISYKIHGTSLCSGYLPVKRKLSLLDRFFKKIGVKIKDKDYDYLWSSRKVIKNSVYNKNCSHYYDLDIWGLAHNKIKHALQKDMMIYAEIVGFLPNGKPIQKDYDYGCENGSFEVYVYRITFVNNDGVVYEFTPNQIKEYCKNYNIKIVPNLYYGEINLFYKKLYYGKYKKVTHTFDRNIFLSLLKEKYLEKDCIMCKNTVPAEGVVLRLDTNDFEAYKLKSTSFYERETKLLDEGEYDIEES